MHSYRAGLFALLSFLFQADNAVNIISTADAFSDFVHPFVMIFDRQTDRQTGRVSDARTVNQSSIKYGLRRTVHCDENGLTSRRRRRRHSSWSSTLDRATVLLRHFLTNDLVTDWPSQFIVLAQVHGDQSVSQPV